MARIIIALKGEHILVDNEWYEYLNQFSWCISNGGYAIKGSRENTVEMSKEIMEPSGDLEVDHKDLNSLNNQELNLRICTHSQNMMNRRIPSINTTGFKGVRAYGDFYRAQIGLNGRMKYLGIYWTAEDAARSYDDSAIEFFGEFARLNFPDSKKEDCKCQDLNG